MISSSCKQNKYILLCSLITKTYFFYAKGPQLSILGVWWVPVAQNQCLQRPLFLQLVASACNKCNRLHLPVTRAIVKYQNVLPVCCNRMYKVFSFESYTVCAKLLVCPLQVQSCSSELQAKHRLPVLSGVTQLEMVCCLVSGLGFYSVGQVFVFVLDHIAGFPCQS